MRLSSESHPALFIGASLLLSLLTAYVCAAVYVVMLQWSLPRSDLAYGKTIREAFSDPSVRLIGVGWATAVGLVFFPLATFCLWRKELLRCGFLVLGATLLAIVLITPLSIAVGFIASPLAALSALIFCRHSTSSALSSRGAR